MCFALLVFSRSDKKMLLDLAANTGDFKDSVVEILHKKIFIMK